MQHQPTWSRSRAVLEDGLKAGLHRGAQVAVSVGGELHEWCVGEARPGVPMLPDTINLWLSAGKPLTAVLLARLVGRRILGWDDAVSRWIPEFGGGGKEALTIRHLLTHTGGFRGADKADVRSGWDESVAFACATPLEPGWIPGETPGYHANGSWFVLGELARRVTGLPFADLIRDEVCEPLGLGGGWFGIGTGDQTRLADRLAIVDRTGRHGMHRDEVLNDPMVLARCRPGSGLRTTAGFLCRFYRALLSPPEGWLEPAALRSLLEPRGTTEPDRTFRVRVDFGMGFLLNTHARTGGLPMPYGYGALASAAAFGHSGNQCSCGFADPARGLSVAWVCNGMPGEPLHQARQHALNTALYEDAGVGSG